MDVAKRSGFSRATVSYVLNETPGQSIPASTRQRVLDAAAELGYIPSAHAQALARGHSKIVVIDLSDVPAGVVMGDSSTRIADELDARGYVPVIAQSLHGRADHSLLLALCASVVPAAVITTQELPVEVTQRLRQLGVPRIAAISPGADAIHESVRRAAACQIDHLVNRGHRRLGYVPTPSANLADLDRVRYDAARARAVSRDASLTRLRPIDGARAGDEAVSSAVHSGISALAAYNDEVALAVLAAASRSGVSVPGDVAVMGIDDIPLAALTNPRLTTVAQAGTHPVAIHEFVDRLLLADAASTILPEWTPEVVIRESA
jgi:DNA-binding LacI/PurR family transcriptional regulator